MRILSITAQKPHSTGSGTYLTELVRSWSHAGHDQAVVCGIYPADTVSFPEGVACYPVFFTDTAAPAPADPDFLHAPCKVNKAAGSLKCLPFPIAGMSDIMPYTSVRYRDMTPDMLSQFESAFTDAVTRAVADLDPDLILCHHLFLLTAIVRKLFPGRKVLGLSHGSDLRQMVNCPHLHDTVRPGIAALDAVLALNDTQKKRITDLFGISEDRISIIGSGYNDKLFNTSSRAPRDEIIRIAEGKPVPVMISYAGKISRSKGVPELIRVLRSLEEDSTVPYFEAVLAGGCPDEEIRKTLDDLPQGVTWLGQIPQEHLADIFRYSDIFVLPSYYEGLPLVLIEAMASGAVPVSTDIPGVRPWIESNVPHSSAVFVPMPEMATVDSPTESGRIKFINDLYSALREQIIRIDSGNTPLIPPDTSGITWDGVSARILSI